MIKKIIIGTCLLLSFVSFAQEGTSSPYSFYGIGDVRFKGTLENRSMAGLAIEQDSIHINLQNPASFASLKLTAFTLGGSYNTTKLKTDIESANTRRSTLDYLAIGLPIGKFGVGFGLIPYSSVGYKIKSDGTQSDKKFDGSGGLNKVFLGLGYKIAPNFSIGVDAHYNFGKIETNSLEFISDIPIGTREKNTADLSGLNFNFGTMYQAKINKKLSIFSSVNYTLESTLVSKNIRNITTVQYDSNNNLVNVDPFDDIANESNLKLPNKVSFGAGLGEAKKWLVGAQVTMQNKGSLSNNYNAVENVTYEKHMAYSIGGYYVPDFGSYTSYAKRISYRGGFKYEQTGLVINSESINDIGVTLGIGLPITGSFSNMNFGFEYGKRGTTASGLVQENYANVSVGFSFNDKWFIKRKYD